MTEYLHFIGAGLGSAIGGLLGALFLFACFAPSIYSLNRTLKKLADKEDAKPAPVAEAQPHYVKSIFSGGPADGLVASVEEKLDVCSIRMAGTRLHWYRRMDWTKVFFYQGYEETKEGKTKNESHIA